MKGGDTPSAARRPRCSPGTTVEIVDSRELLGGGGKLIIRHGDEIYTLRVTVNGRLILTK